MRTALGLTLALATLAACAATLDLRSRDVGPTFNNEPAITQGGCCLLNYGCAGPDDDGVYWADFERRIPCFSTCGAVVEGHVRDGNRLADARQPVETYGGGGVMVDQVCAR